LERTIPFTEKAIALSGPWLNSPDSYELIQFVCALADLTSASEITTRQARNNVSIMPAHTISPLALLLPPARIIHSLYEAAT